MARIGNLKDPVTAAAVAQLFLQKQLRLSEEDADEIYDSLIRLMEQLRDETYRMGSAG